MPARQEGARWVRRVMDGVAVVLSILLAFAIDAWWDGLELRRAEQQAIVDLRADFVENLDVANSAVAHHSRSIDAGVLLLQAARGDAPVPDRPLLDSLLFFSFVDFTTYEPASAVLDDLLSSGRLGLIQDDSLRMALASWPGSVDELLEDQRFIRSMVQSALLPYLTDRISTVDLYVSAHAGYGTFSASRNQSDLASLLRDRAFESHLANRVGHERQAVTQIRTRIRPLIELVLNRLEVAIPD